MFPYFNEEFNEEFDEEFNERIIDKPLLPSLTKLQ